MSHINPFSRLPRQHPSFTRRAARAAASCVIVALGACSVGSSVEPGPSLTPAAIAVSGGAQTGAAGNTLPIPVIVRVTDPSGMPVSFATVSFAPVASSGAVNVPTLLTDTTGSAGVLWTLGTAPGVDSLTVTVTGLPAITVTATVTPGAPDTITIVSGDAQSAPAGTALSTPLAIRIADKFGNAVANANVSWSSDANGAFSSAGAVTDAGGRAQAIYTLGATAGLQHVTVVVSTAAGAILTVFSETGT